MSRALRRLCSLVLAWAVVGCGHPPSAIAHGQTYRGWYLGIPLERAQALTRAETGDSLTCDQRTLPGTTICQSSSDSAVAVSTMTITGAPGPYDISIKLPLVVARDSVVELLQHQWGQPNARADTVRGWGASSAAAWRRGDTVITVITYEKKPAPFMTVRIADASHAASTPGPHPTSVKDYAP